MLQNSSETVLCISILLPKKQWNRKHSKRNRYEFIQKQGILMENGTHAAGLHDKVNHRQAS